MNEDLDGRDGRDAVMHTLSKVLGLLCFASFIRERQHIRERDHPEEQFCAPRFLLYRLFPCLKAV